MNEPNPETTNPSEKSFEELSQQDDIGLMTEFWLFIKENKIWWMLPIVVVLAIVGVLAYLTTTAAAPFIYTLF